MSVVVAALYRTGAAEDLELLMRTLIARGHAVTLLTDPLFARRAARIGVRFVPVDDPALPSLGQPPAGPAARIGRIRTNLRATLIDPLTAQWTALQQVLAEEPVDAVVADVMCMGVGILAALPRAERPPIVSIELIPPITPGREVAPYGSGAAPDDSLGGQLRNLLLQRVSEGVLRPLHRDFRAVTRRLTGTAFAGTWWSLPAMADVWAQPTVDRFEYPRARPAANLRQVGPLRPATDDSAPEWWDPARTTPVVVVQMHDRIAFDRLALPVLAAVDLATTVVVIVGTTRAEAVAGYGAPLPPTVHVEDAVPWSQLVPSRTVFVSPGDYVKVQHALRKGVPVVATGSAESQVETRARIERAGVGVGIAVPNPTPAMLADAIARVRTDQGILGAVARIAAQIDRTDAERSIGDIVDELVGPKAGAREPATR